MRHKVIKSRITILNSESEFWLYEINKIEYINLRLFFNRTGLAYDETINLVELIEVNKELVYKTKQVRVPLIKVHDIPKFIMPNGTETRRDRFYELLIHTRETTVSPAQIKPITIKFVISSSIIIRVRDIYKNSYHININRKDILELPVEIKIQLSEGKILAQSERVLDYLAHKYMGDSWHYPKSIDSNSYTKRFFENGKKCGLISKFHTQYETE
jgi:hypothetical protein